MQTDLFALVRKGNLPELRQTFSTACNSELFLQCRDSDGNTLLHVAPNPIIAAYLLQHKVPVDARNKQYKTPLLSMVWDTIPTDFKLAALLLDHGADLSACDSNQHNTMHLSASKSREFVKGLLTYVPYSSINLRRLKNSGFIIMLCFKRPENPRRLVTDVCKIIASYCLLPPFYFPKEDELNAINALVSEKLDVVSRALTAQDNEEMTPEALEELYYAHDERARLLNPTQIKLYVPDIIASINRLVTFRNTYAYQDGMLTCSESPSTVQSNLDEGQ